MAAKKREKNKKLLHDPLAWLSDDQEQEDDEVAEPQDAAEISTESKQVQIEPDEAIDPVEGEDWGLFSSEETEQTVDNSDDQGWGLFDNEPATDKPGVQAQADSTEESLEEDNSWGLFDDDNSDIEAHSTEDNALLAEGGWGLFDDKLPLNDEDHDGWGLFASDTQQEQNPEPKGPGWGLFKDNIKTDESYIILPESLTIKEVEESWKEIEQDVLSESDKLFFDASLVEYIDGAGVQFLFAMEHYAHELNKKFEVANPSEIVTNALVVAGYQGKNG